MLAAFLDEFAGVSARTITIAAAALALLLGSGHLLCYMLKVKFRETPVRLFLSLTLGFAVAALFFFIGAFDRRLLGLSGMFLKLSGMCGCWIFFQESDFFRPFFRKDAWKPFPVFPVILAVLFAFLSLAAFQYPASWDECVYQLTVPVRWAADGGVPRVYQDLPYSGFPLLPQFLWTYMLISGSSLAAVKIVSFVMTVCFFALLYLLAETRRTRAVAGTFAISLLFAPLMLHMVFSGYAEPIQGCFVAGALLLIRKGGRTWRTMLLAGLLAGAAAAVKLTGCFLAAAIFLYAVWYFRTKWKNDRILLAAFAGAAALMAAPFYLRPWILTGNPCYPYLGDIFGTPTHAVTYFHYALGTDKFARYTITTFLLLIPGIVLPSFSAMFDGSFGYQFFFWLVLPVVCFCMRIRKSAKVAASFGLFCILVFCWLVTSPQLRFLLPALPFLAIAVRDSSGYLLRGKRVRRRVFLACCLISTIYAFPEGQIHAWKSNLRAMLSGPDGNRDILYARTGDSMLPLAELLRKPPLSEVPGKCLLILEERTLYLPQEKCEIATPFFQPKYFPDGKLPNAEDFGKLLLDNNIGMIYIRTPEKNPDYLPGFADLWYNEMQGLLSGLVESGSFEAHGLPGPAWIYVRKAPPLPMQ